MACRIEPGDPGVDSDDDVDTSETDASQTDASDTDASETTTGEGTADPCPALCTVVDQCNPEADYDECLGFCHDEFEQLVEFPECAPSIASLYSCVGELSCEEYDAWRESTTPPFPCSAEQEQVKVACEGVLACDLNAGLDEAGNYCLYQLDCQYESVYRVDCSVEEGCSCSVDGRVVGECDELFPGICEEFDPQTGEATILERMNECCGWSLEF